jgi:hypothetical protein
MSKAPTTPVRPPLRKINKSTPAVAPEPTPVPVSRFGPDDGMSTAEYAVGTVAACGFAGVLWAVVHSSAVSNALQSLVQHALTLAS